MVTYLIQEEPPRPCKSQHGEEVKNAKVRVLKWQTQVNSAIETVKKDLKALCTNKKSWNKELVKYDEDVLTKLMDTKQKLDRMDDLLERQEQSIKKIIQGLDSDTQKSRISRRKKENDRKERNRMNDVGLRDAGELVRVSMPNVDFDIEATWT